MRDAYLRRQKEKWLTKLVTHAHLRNLAPNMVTLVALVVGLLSAAAVVAGLHWLGLLLWVVNRVLDGLDGTLARLQNKQSLFGGYLDLLLDYVIYLAVPISFVIAAPSTFNLWALVLLLSSFYVNTMSWAGLSALLEQKRLADPDRLTSIEMPSGLIEGAETILFYSLLFILPNHVAILFSVMAVLVFVTVGQRLWWAASHLRPISPGCAHPPAKVVNLSLPSGN